MIENAIRKVVRVEKVPQKSKVETRVEMVSEYKAVLDIWPDVELGTLSEKYNDYVKARAHTEPKEEIVIFDTFRAKLPR